jgi:glycosyltransferase involved in cell wall biosynthesis
MKTAVIIPAYNAAACLRPLLDQVFAHVSKHDVIVVDDGSTDGTGEIARSSGVELIIHRQNKGKGAALKSGFALALQKGCDAVITMDADGQHDPRYLDDLKSVLNAGHYDIVIGSRNKYFSDMSFARFLSNNVTSVVVSLLAGQRIPDSQSGYRIIKTEVLRKVDLRTDRYQMESELLIKAGRQGFRIEYLDISVKPSKSSHISHFTDTMRFLRMALQTLWT